MNNVQIRQLEIFSIIGLIIFAVLSFILTNFVIKKETKDISIFQNGIQITHINNQEININTSGTYIIGDINEDYNTIEIKNQKVRCIDANCPNKVCVSHGYLNPDIDNDMIVCAPHKLIIQYK